jgi:hypothetical protein
VLSDEILPSGKVVRKVALAPTGIAGAVFVSNPEIFGTMPRDPPAGVSIGEHAPGIDTSPFISASTLRRGASNMAGTPFWIDLAKAAAAGVRFHLTEALVVDAITNVEKEALLEGTVPAGAIVFGAAGYFSADWLAKWTFKQ